MITELKQELIDKINLTEDENLLKLLKADYDFFTHEGKNDFTDDLSNEDLNELIELINEPFGFETVSLEEFKNATSKWRTK